MTTIIWISSVDLILEECAIQMCGWSLEMNPTRPNLTILHYNYVLKILKTNKFMPELVKTNNLEFWNNPKTILVMNPFFQNGLPTRRLIWYCSSYAIINSIIKSEGHKLQLKYRMSMTHHICTSFKIQYRFKNTYQ